MKRLYDKRGLYKKEEKMIDQGPPFDDGICPRARLELKSKLLTPPIESFSRA